ncbi:bifunctional hydroxymethylpyrimidine kinase/phosphomethylpyrimidine kinase [[Pseudomonas] carboxydohydrogena]|uniref:hydroxymethylpyrimidine kinase n=1 Tax=Afipia carboxydohydrogena TaxID=290 RepID=A0ABY8BRI9_AFICR|nr:bifunctional hydroxymethylpyrimidine kinase/phosphomethylpyrimidine kinase [[Pseudomonas] carboxydohydrogena]WEF52588.1 bifunctional hydroxymethylpyrimidine kinase/phosphomethylpyrimidine kinase [[Pseudomonas] carboxydohydrogena]
MAFPVALTIAGSDTIAGAGIQADLKTFSALGVYGTTVITALTAQNTRGVSAINEAPADFVKSQIDAVMSDLPVGAVKIGMTASQPIIEVIAERLAHWQAKNVVLDPVMIATSGDRLLADGAIEAMRTVLMPRATLVTPNLPEAAALLDEQMAQTEDEIADQGRRILKLGAPAVLIKGGHGAGPSSIDYLVTANGVVSFVAPRINTRNVHGTGCTLSSAIAAGLAKGEGLEAAVRQAKDYVSAAIANADRLQLSNDHGPIHHFHTFY